MWLQCSYIPLPCSLALHSVVLSRLFSIAEAWPSCTSVRTLALVSLLCPGLSAEQACQQCIIWPLTSVSGLSRSCLIAGFAGANLWAGREGGRLAESDQMSGCISSSVAVLGVRWRGTGSSR
ncbi:hypothetical protein COO60DRAFT_1074449 [Scenedesmus sp. NREL 46B-D3]|nr:hypothetical protein COO60DRAFT_1074449 [Scenedesmus sp. NREL 46B-D3]